MNRFQEVISDLSERLAIEMAGGGKSDFQWPPSFDDASDASGRIVEEFLGGVTYGNAIEIVADAPGSSTLDVGEQGFGTTLEGLVGKLLRRLVQQEMDRSQSLLSVKIYEGHYVRVLVKAAGLLGELDARFSFSFSDSITVHEICSEIARELAIGNMASVYARVASRLVSKIADVERKFDIDGSSNGRAEAYPPDIDRDAAVRIFTMLRDVEYLSRDKVTASMVEKAVGIEDVAIDIGDEDIRDRERLTEVLLPRIEASAPVVPADGRMTADSVASGLSYEISLLVQNLVDHRKDKSSISLAEFDGIALSHVRQAFGKVSMESRLEIVSNSSGGWHAEIETPGRSLYDLVEEAAVRLVFEATRRLRGSFGLALYEGRVLEILSQMNVLGDGIEGFAGVGPDEKMDKARLFLERDGDVTAFCKEWGRLFDIVEAGLAARERSRVPDMDIVRKIRSRAVSLKTMFVDIDALLWHPDVGIQFREQVGREVTARNAVRRNEVAENV